jgi:hypothetical protein
MNGEQQGTCSCGGQASASTTTLDMPSATCLRDAPVPAGFNQAVEGLAFDPAALPEVGLMESAGITTPLRMTEMTLDPSGLEHTTPHLLALANCPLRALVCNHLAELATGEGDDRPIDEEFGSREPLYFSDPCEDLPGGEEILLQQRAKSCAGFYISYDPRSNEEKQAVARLLAVMKGCGLESVLGKPRAGCCRANGKQHVKVELKPGARIGKGMERIADMISSTQRGFCLAINLKFSNDIDRYTRAPRTEDSQINPDMFSDPRMRREMANFRPHGSAKTYDRSNCEVLAHIIAENYIGNSKGRPYLSYEEAHARALAEENWVRHANGKGPIEPGPSDDRSRNIMVKQTRTIKEEEKKRTCSSPATVSCTNHCPGGTCCPDPITPSGWVHCGDICTPGSGPWCP